MQVRDVETGGVLLHVPFETEWEEGLPMIRQAV